jgi:protein-ribulosamine 3-kinase
MVHIPSDFEAPVVPDLGEFERELDPAILAGRSRNGTQQVKEANIRKVLPDGCKVDAIAVHGASHWALIHRIDTTLPDGTQQMYFLKVLTGNLGQEMAQGEYEGNKAIHAIIPRNVPRPVAHGTYTKNSDRHFFLSTFHEMEDEMPLPKDFVSVVAQLHQKSVSPTGKFGFHVTTHAGNYPLQNSWCDSWEEFFVRQLKTEIVWERGVQGQNDEMDELYEAMFKNVIPRLLRPLQTGGRSIKPSLVHGDLWHGNVGVDMTSNEPILYDPCATYAHNECEIPYEVLLPGLNEMLTNE